MGSCGVVPRGQHFVALDPVMQLSVFLTPRPLHDVLGAQGGVNVDTPFATEHSITLLFLEEAKARLPPSKMQF